MQEQGGMRAEQMRIILLIVPCSSTLTLEPAFNLTIPSSLFQPPPIVLSPAFTQFVDRTRP